MYYKISHDHYLPTVLIVQENQTKLASDSAILSGFNQVNIPRVEATTIVIWVQRHQPDLIIFDIDYSQIVQLGLITALRLDWLTRKIPILVISNISTKELQSRVSLDCNAYLKKLYSTKELEQTICSLVPTPACKSYVTVI
jgi:PleD family two-component response regulator